MILVVDDHVDTADFLCRILGRNGYLTHCVHSGEEALTFFQSETPRLVILDVQMPGMTGLEVLEFMSADERCREIPVLIYSAGHEKSQSDLALRLGAKAYLVKGVVAVGTILKLVAMHATPAAPAT